MEANPGRVIETHNSNRVPTGLQVGNAARKGHSHFGEHTGVEVEQLDFPLLICHHKVLSLVEEGKSKLLIKEGHACVSGAVYRLDSLVFMVLSRIEPQVPRLFGHLLLFTASRGLKKVVLAKAKGQRQGLLCVDA